MPTNKAMTTPTGTVYLTEDSGSESYSVDRVNANTEKIADGITSLTSEIAGQTNVLAANWTATQTSANNEKVTEDLLLTAGLWLVILTVPFATSGTPIVRIDGSGTMFAHQFGTTDASGAQTIKVINVDSNGMTVYGASSSSAVVTYDSSYISRGGLIAVRLKKG